MSTLSATPAVVLHAGLGALTVVRSLGTFGVQVTCADTDTDDYAMRSRYCHNRLVLPDFEREEERALRVLLEYGRRQSQRPILYPMTDQYILFVSRHRERLLEHYDFVLSDHDVLEKLINKLGLFDIAQEHNLPVPLTRIPNSSTDLPAIGEELGFPCLLKTSYSHSPLKQTDDYITKVHSLTELTETYTRLSAIDAQLMLQEYIPGEDNNIHIFAAYFDGRGEPRLTFTGRKLRQKPIDFGAGSICECVENKPLEKIMIRFCRAIGYRGNIDVGLKFDPVQGVCKVLDINPRLGMNHRTFVTRDKLIDMARAAHLDLTEGLGGTLEPRLGRKWVVEDSDLISSVKYMKADRLTFTGWIKSYKGLEEVAYFSLRDWKPWLIRYRKWLGNLAVSLWKRLFRYGPRSQPS